MRRGGVWLWLLTLTTLAVAISWSWRARASSISVNPIRLHLSQSAPGSALSLSNTGVTRARFQIKAYTWQQNESGEMKLEPTEDLVVFPSLLQIDPGQTRRIRVRSVVRAAATEKSYRIFIEELLPLDSARAQGIQMLTRFGVPIFLQPETPVATPRLRVDSQSDRLDVSLENAGNSYLVTESLEVTGRSRQGEQLFRQDLSGWYVLAGGRRRYAVLVPPSLCGQLVEVTAHAKTDHGVADARQAVAAHACAPP